MKYIIVIFSIFFVTGCGSTEVPPTEPAPAEPVAEPEAPSDPPAGPPNVLFIVWDTVRADRLGPYGYERRTTPYLSRLAERSVVYERAVSPGIWTFPSHSSLFTGKVVTEHGVNGDYQRLDDEHLTMAEALSDVGYDTFAFSANPFVTKETGLLQGYENVYHPWDKQFAKAVRNVMKRHIIKGDVNGVDATRERKGDKHWTYQVAAPIAHDVLLEWLDGRENTEAPFLAFINVMEAHATRLPSMKSREKLIDPKVDARAKRLDQSARAQLAWMAGANPMDEMDLKAMSQVYDATLLDLDKALSKLMSALEERQLSDSTILVLTSDHGDALGAHERMGHQFHVYNSVSRVPLLMSWPDHFEPARVTEPVSTADVFKLLISEGGLPVKTEVAEAITSRASKRKEGAVTQYTAVLPGSLTRLRKKNPKADLSSFERTYTAMEWGNYKLIEDSAGGRELYDVVADPHETRELSGSDPAALAKGIEHISAWKSAHTQWERQGETTVFDANMQAGLEALGYVSSDDE